MKNNKKTKEQLLKEIDLLKAKTAKLEKSEIEWKQAEDKIHRRAMEYSALLKISQAASATLDLDNVLQLAVNSIVDMINIDTAAIYLIEGEELYLGATIPPR